MLPLHPIVVHFPIVLAVLLPIFALGALWAIRKGTTPRRAWSIPAALAVALAVSAFVAVETGEADDERVERVVPEQPIETHEEAAETFLMLSGALALLTAAGLVRGRIGGVARGLGTAGAVGLVALAGYVGHSGGKLVYEHGAASAHTRVAAGTSPAPRQRDADDGDDR